MTNIVNSNKNFEKVTYKRLDNIEKIMKDITDKGYEEKLNDLICERLYAILENFKYIIDGKSKITSFGMPIGREKLIENTNMLLDRLEDELNKIMDEIAYEEKRKKEEDKKFSKYYSYVDKFSALQDKCFHEED
jgi:hypothetical protein